MIRRRIRDVSVLLILLLALILLVSSACGTLDVGVLDTPAPGQTVAATTPAIAATDPATSSPSAAVATPAPPATLETVPPTPSESVTPVPDSAPGGLALPRSLYFLSTNRGPDEDSRSVWRLAPGDTEVERVTPPDLWIRSFDVWLDDGRMAYGTRDGQLYVAIPGQEPRLLYDAGLQADDAVEIDSVAWSPEGTRLAYTVQVLSYDPGSPGEYDGLWLFALDSDTPVKLLNNRHLEADYGNINDARNVSDPVWSPDGTALILTGHYWEWIDVLWLDPVAPDPNETNLHRTHDQRPQCPQCPDFLDQFWTGGSWANDGVQSRASGLILLSGTNYGDFSDLVRVRRDFSAWERLIDGEAEDMFVYNAQELPDGIAFLARLSSDPQETRLYLGRQAEDGFRYAPAGPDHALCSPGGARGIAWDPAGRLAALSCERGAELISLDGTDVAGWADLTPFLGPLAGEGHLQVTWGPSRKVDLPTYEGYTPDTRTGVHIVDAIIEAVLADDLDAERALVHYTTTACTTESGLGGPPKCRADETEGTLVEAFPVLGVEGRHVRREEIDGVFLSGSKALYAVFRVPAEAFDADYWPAGEYGVVFVHDDPHRPYLAATTFLADAGGIVRVVYSQSPTSSLRMDYGLEVEEFILPPFYE